MSELPGSLPREPHQHEFATGERRPKVPNKTARNEQRKLLATWLNTLASATVTVGILAPAAGILYGFSIPGPNRTFRELAGFVAAWLGTGVALHLLARSILGRIEE